MPAEEKVECQRAALSAPDPDIRQMYLDLAKQWKELAEHAVAIERHRRRGLFQGRLRAVAKALMRYRHMVPSLHALHEATNVFDSATQALMEKSATDI